MRYVPLWFFENTQGYLRFKKSSTDTEGVDLEPGGWMVSASNAALMEATAVCFIIKRFAQGDWACCSERFGTPTPVYNSTANRNTPEWNEAVETLANLANGCGMVLAAGEVFDLKQPSGTGEPFKTLVDSMDRYIALIWRGSDLSTLSADNAAGASLQADESEILEDSDCALVEETLAHYLSLPALEWRFGKGTKPAAYLQLTRKNRKDKLNQIAVYKGAAELGCKVAKRDVYEALELRQPESGEDTVELSQTLAPSTPPPFANSAKAEDSAIDRVAAALGDMAQPFYDELARIEAMSDASARGRALENLLENLGQYFDGGKAEAEAWMEILKEEFENGK